MCSTAHPLAAASPAFAEVDLSAEGLAFAHAEIPLAHPLAPDRPALLYRDVARTASQLGVDGARWQRLVGPMAASADRMVAGVLDPTALPPREPLWTAAFGAAGLWPTTWVDRVVLRDDRARAPLAESTAHDRFPSRYRRRLERWRYGSGSFGAIWALDGPVPWSDPALAGAGVLHIGGPATEVIDAERAVARGRIPRRPFVLFAQATVADPARAPLGKHTGWGYCHVRHGSDLDMAAVIEEQVERFAPGFRERILAWHSMGPAAPEAHNANEIGGDIGGSTADWRLLAARPVLSVSPWATPDPQLFLCSSSTLPGGGVHGMCGWNAARTVLTRLG